jgi:subtilisin family serine protease
MPGSLLRRLRQSALLVGGDAWMHLRCCMAHTCCMMERLTQAPSACDCAGGANNDVTVSYPANYALPNVVSVAAIDSAGALASFSQYGSRTVHLGAPGVGIWSTVAFNKLASYSGTSMATPHVSGAVALYASKYPGATAAQIKGALLKSAAPTASLAGKTITGGRLDIGAMLGITPASALP